MLVLRETIEKPKVTEHAVKRSFAFFLIISIFLLIIGVSVVSNNAEAKARAQRSYNNQHIIEQANALDAAFAENNQQIMMMLREFSQRLDKWKQNSIC